MSAPVPPHQVGHRPPEPEQRGPGGSPVALDKEALSSDPERLGSGCRASQRGKKKKKKYNRHTKPPYTYLAMIALVIQASPDRKLKLSQIIREISTLFPFFNEGYQGWKDSIRHNLSSNDCFRKVLKDPGKPRAKGNFWTVDVERIPPEALKLQNTPVSRQGKVFAGDLAPYVYHGWTLGGGGGSDGSGAPHNHRATTAPEGSSGLAGDGMRQTSPFSIDSLLSDFQDVGLCGKASLEAEPNGLDAWGPVPIYSLSSGAPLPPWRPSCQVPTLHSFSSSGSLSPLSSSSPCGREEGGLPRPKKGATGAHTLAKRARVLQDADSSSSDSEGGAPPFGAPAPSAPHWEQLPTSYTKSVAPNVVAPASCLSPFSVLPAVTGLPFGAVPYANPVCWEMMPRPPLGPAPPSGLSAALDLVMPPNKTVFDVWASHPVDSSLCSDLAKTCASLNSIVGGHYATS